jgi:4-amino-4-deoxy-L-arabinose transferase-like glycosyltransferase
MENPVRGAAKSLWPILVVALGARLYFLYTFQAEHPRQAVSVIPFLFECGNIAHSLATGHGFASPFRVDTGPTAWMTPLFPMIIAGVFRIFGVYTFHSWLAVVLLNIACCTAACVPIFLIGSRIGGRTLGTLAAWIWAIFPNAILLPVESMWDACFSALLAVTILWATLLLDDAPRLRNWCAYGLLWGITLMINATLGALLPFLLAWLAFRAWKAKRQWLPQTLLTTGVVILCCVPWTIRNYSVFHQFVPLRSVLGLQLWLGNNDHTQDIFRGDLHPIYNADERAHYIAVGELSYMHEKRREALQYMWQNPEREAHLISRRFVSIWSGGTPYPLADFLESSSWWFRYVLVFNLVAGIGALLGIILLFRRRNPYAFPVAVFPLVYPWAFYLTLALPRYRLPIDPVVMLLFGVSILQVFGRTTSQTDLPSAPSHATKKRKRAHAS